MHRNNCLVFNKKIMDILLDKRINYGHVTRYTRGRRHICLRAEETKAAPVPKQVDLFVKHVCS